MTDAMIETVKRDLGSAYMLLIGYNPFHDDPTITIREVAETLADYLKEAAADFN